jgi:hypothetical protein
MPVPTDFEGADKKLRQAAFFRDHLEYHSTQIARDMIRGGDADHQFALEAFCSASLGAAQSCFYVLHKTGGQTFKTIEARWRNNTLDQAARTRFNAMTTFRDNDVHYGELPVEALPKMIEMRDDSNHSAYYYNPSIHGPRVPTVHINPDGHAVSSYSGLRGTIGLYVELCGERVEALTACANFIDQLQSLIQALRAADLPDNSQTVHQT